MDVGQTIHRPNPFATRYIASARLLPRDEQGGILNLASLVARLDALGGSGAIVGPHGTGKSTVLSHLGDFIAAGKRPVGRARLRSRRDIPAAVRSVCDASRGGLLCIDSWELLGLTGRAVVRGLARARRVGLLVTSHGPAGLPTLTSGSAGRSSPPIWMRRSARLTGTCGRPWTGSTTASNGAGSSCRRDGASGGFPSGGPSRKCRCRSVVPIVRLVPVLR